MPTLQALRSNFYDMLRETEADSHFTASQANGLLNQGKDFIAILSNSATDRVSTTVQQSKGAYLLPSDNLLLQMAYFGDVSKANDVPPLTIITERVLTNLFPNWQDETANADGQPRYLLKLDRQTIYIHPRPNADYAGKKLILVYGYLPANMTADSDEPDIPLIFHNLIPFYACHLAYLSLSNPEVSDKMLSNLLKQYNIFKDTVDRETEETFAWKWLRE